LLRRIGEIGKHNLSCLIEGMLDSRVGNSAIPYELRDVNPKPYQRCNQVYLIASIYP